MFKFLRDNNIRKEVSMYKFILFLVLIAVACSTQPRVPTICQRNLNDCLSDYQDSPHKNEMSEEAWAELCQRDLKVCRYNRGIY
jgi:hypothetical protein